MTPDASSDIERFRLSGWLLSHRRGGHHRRRVPVWRSPEPGLGLPSVGHLDEATSTGVTVANHLRMGKRKKLIR